MKFDNIDKSVIAIIEYGSYARGDNDEFSDYDLFILVSEENVSVGENIKEVIEKDLNGRKCDISIYNMETFQLMLKQGSLFLWHLKTEGKIIYTKDGDTDLFEDLNEFIGIEEDIFLYKRLISSAILSLDKNGVNYYDLNILSLATRNILILLCYKIGSPSFGRRTAFVKAKEILKEALPLEIEIYNELLDYRLAYSRSVGNRKLPDTLHVKQLVKQVDDLLVYSMKKLEVYNNLDRVFFLLKNKIDRNLYASFEIVTEFERDLYISLMKKCEVECKYLLKGLSEIHKEEFYNKFNKDSLDKYIIMGFEIYDSFQVVKKTTSTYGADSSNIFKYQFSQEALIWNKKYLESLNNNIMIRVMKKINISCINKLIDKHIEELESEIEKGDLTQKILEYSQNARKYL